LGNNNGEPCISTSGDIFFGMSNRQNIKAERKVLSGYRRRLVSEENMTPIWEAVRSGCDASEIESTAGEPSGR